MIKANGTKSDNGTRVLYSLITNALIPGVYPLIALARVGNTRMNTMVARMKLIAAIEFKARLKVKSKSRLTVEPMDGPSWMKMFKYEL